MSGASDDTRRLLLEAALSAFARDGVAHASLLEITRTAGQRNRGAVHYHFGSREGLLVAVLRREGPGLLAREHELLAVARQRPDDDLRSALEAVVRPTVELGDRDAAGTDYLQIVRELIVRGQTATSPEVVEAFASTGGREVYVLIRDRMPPLPADVEIERLALTTTFILSAVAERARALRGDEPARPQLDTESFVQNLLTMVTAMLGGTPA